MATRGINSNTQKVTWRPTTDVLTAGLQSDIWDIWSQTLSAIEVPTGFTSTSLTFEAAAGIQAVSSGTKVPASYQDAGVAGVRNPTTGDNRYLEDLLQFSFKPVLDEAGTAIVLTVAAGNIYGLDDSLAELSGLKYLRVIGNLGQVAESFLRIHSKEA